jgi:CspA family cold shock protein
LLFVARTPYWKGEYRRRSAELGETPSVSSLFSFYRLSFDHASGTLWTGGNIKIWDYQSMTTGTVKWFNPAKGFGFIQPEDGSNDAFVHISAVERAGLSTLNEGQKVSYDLQAGQNGKSSAENLTIVE